jgi:type VI secretion system lysozyme-related protein
MKPVSFRVPLFERLSDAQPGQAETTPLRLFSQEAAVASICAELSRLLNTRRHSQPLLDDYSTIDYGIADWSGFKTGFVEDRRQFVRDIKQAISVFEPRLKNIQIEMLSADGRNAALSICAHLRGTEDERLVLSIVPTSNGLKVEEKED